MVLNYSKRPYTAWGWPGPVSMVRTILSGVKHTLGTLRGNKCFFTSSLLPFSVLTPPPLLAGFLLALLSVDYWLIPPSPIGTTQGVRTRAQRGDFHTMIWITEAFYVWSLIFPPFALLGNHHRVPFIAYGFPSRNLRLHAQTRNVFPL